MKLAILILSLTVLNAWSTYAGTNPELFKEISRKSTFVISSAHLTSDAQVDVWFVVKKKKLIILGVRGGSQELQALVTEKLSNIELGSGYEGHEIYRYRYNFQAEK